MKLTYDYRDLDKELKTKRAGTRPALIETVFRARSQMSTLMKRDSSMTLLDTIAHTQPVKSTKPNLGFIREGVKYWTPKHAAIVAEHCRYEQQKRDRTAGGQEHIETLAAIMKDGKWRSQDSIHFARLPDDTLIQVNGTHRMFAQILANINIEWHIVIYPCETMHDVAVLYCSFDTTLRICSRQNIIAAVELPRMLGVSHTTAESIYNATPLLFSEFNFEWASRDRIFERLADRRIDFALGWEKEAKAWEATAAKAPILVKRGLRTVGAMAVMLIVFKYQPDMGEQFLRGVSENDQLRRTDPRAVYLRFLTGNFNPENKARQKFYSSSEGTAKVIATAWNAHFECRDLTLIKALDGQIRIAGTPIGRGK